MTLNGIGYRDPDRLRIWVVYIIQVQSPAFFFIWFCGGSVGWECINKLINEAQYIFLLEFCATCAFVKF